MPLRFTDFIVSLMDTYMKNRVHFWIQIEFMKKGQIKAKYFVFPFDNFKTTLTEL